MDPSRLTPSSRQALGAARTVAMDRGHTHVDAAHLLEGLLGQEGASIHELVRALGEDPIALRAEARAVLVQRPACEVVTLPGQVFLTQGLLSILEAAEQEALLASDGRVSVGHLLSALVHRRAAWERSGGQGEGTMADAGRAGC